MEDRKQSKIEVEVFPVVTSKHHRAGSSLPINTAGEKGGGEKGSGQMGGGEKGSGQK